MARQPVRRRRRTAAPSPGAWSVVPVDGAPVRRKARREYEKVMRDLDAAKADAERFETQDKPLYGKWISANFGALLTELRELQEKLFQAQDLVNEVQQEFYYGNYRSIANAYKKVMKRRSEPEELPGEEEPKLSAEEEAQVRKDFEEIFGEAAKEFWSEFTVDPEDLGARPPRRAKASGQLKDLYRKLVRLLHPDKGAKRTAKEVEWWHQTQTAYEEGNIEQLEIILTLIEVEQKGSKEASVSVLGQLTTEFKKSLKALKRKITGFKRDVAWNFSQLTDFSSLLRRTRSQLEGEREHMLWLLQKYEKQIESWQATASTPGKRARARRGAWADEEWF